MVWEDFISARVLDDLPDDAVVAGVVQDEGDDRFIITDISTDEAQVAIAEEDAITLSEYI